MLHVLESVKMAFIGKEASVRDPTQTGQKDCQREVKEVFEKLLSWREQSQDQFSAIINAHSSSINWGINDLVEKVDELQTELLVIRKERNVLLDTVDNLNIEIRHLSAKLPNLEPPDKHFKHDIQVLDNSEIEFQNTGEQDVDRQIIKGEPGYEDASVDSVHDGDLLDDWDYMDDTAINDSADEHGNNVEHRLANKDHTQNKVVIQKKEDRLRVSNKRKRDSTTKDENLITIKNNIHPEDVVCPECSFAFSTNENLKIHMANVHPNVEVSEESPRDDDQANEQSDHPRVEDISPQDMKMSPEKKLPEASYNQDRYKLRCEQCPYGTSRRSNLKSHIKAVHDKIRNHVCEKCDYASSQKSDLRIHMITVHKMGEKKFKCEKCPYTSAHKGNFDHHINGVHKKIRNHVCEECDYAASQKKDLRTHMINVHTMGEKKFKCDLCPYTTALKYHFNTHIKGVHKKIRNYVCEDCDYAAKDKSSLNKHIKTVHGKIRNYVCEKCDYAASEKSGLRIHMVNVHKIGEKKFKCEKCPYTSAHKGHLNYHINIVHKKIKTHVCADCGYAASRKRDLEQHKESQHKIGNPKLKCNLCLFETCYKDSLRRHVKKMHLKI